LWGAHAARRSVLEVRDPAAQQPLERRGIPPLSMSSYSRQASGRSLRTSRSPRALSASATRRRSAASGTRCARPFSTSSSPTRVMCVRDWASTALICDGFAARPGEA